MKPPGKTAPKKSFATISASFLGSQRLKRLPAPWLRVLFLAEANWTPSRKVILPIGHVAAELGMSRTTVVSAIKGLLNEDILILSKPAKRPMTPGGAGKGEAAIYDLPGRRLGHSKDRVIGDSIYRGWWKVWSKELRSAVKNLGDAATKVWICAVIPCHRDKFGLPSGRQLEELLPGVSARTANRAIKNLVKVGLIRQVVPQSGRRPGQYERIGASATRIAKGQNKR
jgi:predicted transcriptional regulator